MAASRKRWDSIYANTNPFSLPQHIASGVKSAARARTNGPGAERLRCLWVYVTARGGSGSSQPPLAADEWLSILDESAALGSECVVISTGAGLDAHPEILAMCSWAQETHGMLVGLHVYKKPLTKAETAKLTTLDQPHFALFVDSEILSDMPDAEDMGIRVYQADCDGRELTVGDCTFPESMTCVGPSGEMFACGYVYGSKKYARGHCLERELSAVMSDEAIPHMIPRGDPGTKRRCNGCPPLMQRMLENNAHDVRPAKSNGNGKKQA